MVERIGLAFVIVVGVAGILFAGPRYLGGSTGSDDDGDILTRLERLVGWWMEKPRFWEMGLGLAGVVLLGVGISLFLDPAILGAMADRVGWVAFPLGILGFAGIFSATYLNVRRSGLYSAEATLIGMALVGIVLLILIVTILLEG